MSSNGDIRESFERRRKRSLVVEVRDELERMILCGEVGAGEHLNEYTLAEQMGVSRAPVREAARSLERDGLVTTVANRGAFVRELSVTDVLELYDLRAMIAGHLCARVAECASESILRELRDFVDCMDRALTVGDQEGYFALNLEFHDRIAAYPETGRAGALYIALGKEVRLFRHRVLSGQESLAVSNSEHDKIVTAIEARDVQAARCAGSEHHLNGKRRLEERLRTFGIGVDEPWARHTSDPRDIDVALTRST